MGREGELPGTGPLAFDPLFQVRGATRENRADGPEEVLDVVERGRPHVLLSHAVEVPLRSRGVDEVSEPRQLRTRVLCRLIDDEFATFRERYHALALRESPPLGRIPDHRVRLHVEALHVAGGD